MKNIQNVLWTGGWDSTFRIIQLAQRGAKIQPIYVSDKNRFSRHKELETIGELKEIILNRFGDSKTEILDIKIIKKEDIKFNLIQKISYKVLKKRNHIGRQYYWLSCLALKMKNLELSVHSNDFKFTKGKTVIINDPVIGEYAILDPETKDFFLKKIFKNFRFPIDKLKKIDMKFIAEKENFIDIMNLTWFCHDSDVKPCGLCNPCKQIVRDKMEYRLKTK